MSKKIVKAELTIGCRPIKLDVEVTGDEVPYMFFTTIKKGKRTIAFGDVVAALSLKQAEEYANAEVQRLYKGYVVEKMQVSCLVKLY